MTKSLIRMRMSSHDAHYGGNLVDGAKMLQLFGDVATELLIINDGDEGLFCAYDNVEFLAPVFAGDYIEAVGEITSVGNSSRKMKFEARSSAYRYIGIGCRRTGRTYRCLPCHRYLCSTQRLSKNKALSKLWIN